MIAAAERRKTGIMGFPWSWVARRRGTQSREKEPARVALDAQSTRHGGRTGPKLKRSVYAGPLRAPQPRARENTGDRKRKARQCAKKVHFIHRVHIYQQGEK